MLVKRMKRFSDIDPRSWEHPADRAALSALKQVPGLDQIVKLLVTVTTERSMYLMHAASSIKISNNQYPIVNNIVQEIVETFDWHFTPTVFITQSPFFNAHTFGVNEPCIVINSTLVTSLSREELKVVIAHEMGHVMSGHSLYKTLIWLLANISIKMIPMAGILIMPINIALAEWDRKSELTGDRAALLATQIEDPNFNVLMRMAGGSDLTQVNINELFIQAMEFEERKSLLDSFHKMLNQVWMSHPYPIERLKEIKTWASSGYYTKILEGNYLHRGKHDDTYKEDIRDGFEYYKESASSSEDPLTKMAHNLGVGLESVTSEISNKFTDFIKNNTKS